MNNKQVAREMLKDFQARYPASGRHNVCPFAIYTNEATTIVGVTVKIIERQLHELCAQLFPRWAVLNYNPPHILKCPCHALSHSYVRRKARRFVKEGR